MVDVNVVAQPRVWRQEGVAQSWLEDVEEEEEEEEDVQTPLQKQASVAS